MTTTILSSKGQVIIPFQSTPLRGERPAFPETTLNEVAACLEYHGPVQTLADMEEAIRQGVKEAHHGRG